MTAKQNLAFLALKTAVEKREDAAAKWATLPEIPRGMLPFTRKFIKEKETIATRLTFATVKVARVAAKFVQSFERP